MSWRSGGLVRAATLSIDESLADGGTMDLGLRAAAFNRLQAGAVVLDGEGTILDTNEAWRLFAHLNDGAPISTGRGVNYLEVCDRSAAMGASGAAEVAAGLRQLLSGERDRVDFEYACPSPTEDRWFLMRAAAAPVADGTGVVLFHVDITARKLLSDRLAVLVDEDELTGLPNRRFAARYLDEQLALSRESGSSVSVVFVDLDGFKAVNDVHGHHVGDELLVKVAARTRRGLREHDRLCRMGGDEFVLICPNLSAQNALQVADRLRTVMAAPFQIGDVEINGAVSVGVAESHAGSTVESLLEAADAAMYVDKVSYHKRSRRYPDDVGVPHRDLWPARTKQRSTTPRSTEHRPSETEDGTTWPSPGEQRAADNDLLRAAAGAQARADAAFAHSSDLVLFFEADGTIVYSSPASRMMVGVEPEDLVGRNGFAMIHPDDRERVAREFLALANLGDTVRTEFRVRTATGDLRWFEEIATNRIDDPDVGCIVGNLREVTERVELLQRIEADRRRLADAQASAMLGSFELDLRTGEVCRSDELCRMLGVEPTSSSVSELDHVHPDDRDLVRRAIAEALAGGGQGERVYRIVRADGGVRWVRSQATRLGSPNSPVVVGTMLDITDRHEADMALAHQATHDWLTQLPKVSHLHGHLRSALANAKPHQLVAVAVADMDHFRLVNDRVGHTEGDRILQAVAGRLASGMLSDDFVARIGGDKFVVVRKGLATNREAASLSEDVLATLAEPVTMHDLTLQLTGSVGIAVSAPGDTPVSLLRDSSDALYQAKAQGRNRAAIFDDDARALAHRAQAVSAALPLALERDELHLEYQPILDLETLTVDGFEALLRWEHPQLGSVSPAEFIPIAESTGLILPIGAWVLECASQQLAQWRADPLVSGDLSMAINVSALQLAEPNFAPQFSATLQRLGVPPSAIHVEITESVFMDRVDDAATTVAELRKYGVMVSIDDFGTGYSSLSCLSRLPVDTIKIDRSFINDIARSGHGASIIRTVITLADTLDLRTVAEGVEELHQLELLRQLGCRHAQGFLWSRPMHPDKARWMIDASTR